MENFRRGIRVAATLSSAVRAVAILIALLLLPVLVLPINGQSTASTSSGQSAAAAIETATEAIQTSQPPLIHIVPFGRNSGNPFATAAVTIPPGSKLKYWGGPVISEIHVVAVFWGPNVNTAISVAGGIDQFFTDITQSRFYDLLTEYSTTGLSGAGIPSTSSDQSINRGFFDAKVTISPLLCATVAACSLDDTQIQQEILRQLALGTLPQPVIDAQGNGNTFYMVYFPPGVSISVGGVGSCVTGGFCAYHSNTASRLIPYGVLPDFAPPSGCSTGCGSGTLFENVTAVTSHELSEAVTDPLVGTAPTNAPPLGWYDPDLIPGTNTPLGEIGDLCAGSDTTVTAGGKTYSVQNEFSNVQNDCVSAPPVFTLRVPANVASATSFSLTLTVGHSVTSAALPDYAGTVHFTSSDPAAVLPSDYTFTSADAGSHTFSVTLNTTGIQTITAADTRSSAFKGTVQTVVNGQPDLTIAKSHTGSFTQGFSGDYTVTVSNIGLAPTSGTVTVTDALPAGLLVSGMAGNGWTCNLATVSCTRSDVLAAGASYLPLTLTVAVANNAPLSVTNTVVVSGGGETNTTNNTASDATQILVQQPNLDANLTLPQGTFTQGQTGANYSVVIANHGTASSSGTITVTNILPAGLTATGIAGQGWSCTLSSLTCTRSDVLPINTGFSPITLTFDLDNNAPTGVTVSATVSGGGDLTPANNTSSVFFNIIPMIDIVPTVVQTTVTAGQPAAFNFNVTPTLKAGTVTFACSNLPVGTACTFSPASLTQAGAVSLTVTTTARTAVVFEVIPAPRLPWLPFAVFVAGTLGSLSLMWTAETRFRPAAMVPVLILLAVLSGCGGGGANSQNFQAGPSPTPTPNPNGTPAGTYQFAVKASGSNAGSATQFFILVVK